jgi:prevent-host-death family protein
MVIDYGQYVRYDARGKRMEEIAISKFKATCLAVLERVRRTGQPVRVTRFGKPVAEIMAPTNTLRRVATPWKGRIVGDIVGPIGDESDWEAAGPPGKTELDK